MNLQHDKNLTRISMILAEKDLKEKGKRALQRDKKPMENSQIGCPAERSWNRRVNAQDSRLDTIESNMSQRHQEIMHALRSLGASASTSPKPASRKEIHRWKH